MDPVNAKSELSDYNVMVKTYQRLSLQMNVPRMHARELFIIYFVYD